MTIATLWRPLRCALIEAIKAYRQATKASLLDAKNAVEGIAKWRRQGR